MVEKKLMPVIKVLSELGEDLTVPRNIRLKIETTIKALNENTELSIRVNKALHELDDISNDSNIQSYTRTQIWSVVSMLEKL